MFLLIPLSVWSCITSDSLYCLQSPSVMVYLCMRKRTGELRHWFSHTSCINIKTHTNTQEFVLLYTHRMHTGTKHMHECVHAAHLNTYRYCMCTEWHQYILGLSLLHYRWGCCECVQPVCFLNWVFLSSFSCTLSPSLLHVGSLHLKTSQSLCTSACVRVFLHVCTRVSTSVRRLSAGIWCEHLSSLMHAAPCIWK